MTIPDGFGQATLVFAGTGAPNGAVVTFGIDNVLDKSATAIATEIQVAWDLRIMPNLTNDVALTQVEVKLGPDDTGPTGVSPAGDTGALVASSTPPNTAYLVTKVTSLGGRRGRGRFFIPGVNEATVDDSGNIDGGPLAALQADLDDFLDDLAANDTRMQVLHDPATIWALVGGQPRRIPDPGAPAPPAPTQVTALTLAQRVATQRRRLRN